MFTSALKSITMGAKMVNFILTAFGTTPELQKELLNGTDIKIQQLTGKNGQITAYDEMVVLGNVSKLKGSDWVWRQSDLWQPKLLGTLGEAVMNAPNGDEAINILTRFGHIWGPCIYVEQFHELIHQKKKRILTLNIIPSKNNETLALGMQAMRDICMILVYRMLDYVLEKNWTGAEIGFCGITNISNSYYKRLFPCSVKTEKRRNSFLLSETLCEKDSLVADKLAFRKAVMTLQKTSGPNIHNHTFEKQVTNYLSAVTQGRSSVSDVASALGVSQRTFNRRLQESGTSFRTLLDASLKHRANKLLSTKRHTHADISERLGYKDQASFSRALRRWKKNA